jgi:putative heme-binding domain-containing protein
MALRRTIFILLSAATLASAQAHNYTQGDIEEGIRLYRTSCIGCHGSEGASVSGIDLGRGKFRRVSSDEEIVHVILNGVPGTGMPAIAVAPPRAYTVVAFIRSMRDLPGQKSIAAKSGDANRGKVLFENKGACIGCHQIRGQGGRSGPDLSEAGLTLRSIEVERAMLAPDDEDALRSQPFRVVQKNGSAVRGLLLNQDSFSVQMQDDNGNLRSFSKSELRESGPAKPLMPSYRSRFDAQELADIIAYVGSQRGAAQ